MMYLGDYKEDETVYFIWATNDGNGASITRATDGTISVYKDNSVAQSTAGITDTEDFDGLTGIHACTIDLSADTFYALGADYAVVLSGAVIDGQNVNAVLAHFSIENRHTELDATERNAIADAALSRGVSNVEATADTTSLAAIILAILESSISGTTWTIRKTDSSTFVAKTVTVDADADPITGVT